MRWMRERPHVSLTVLKQDEWYTDVSLRGPVVRGEDDPEIAPADIDRLSQQYRGQDYPERERPRVSAHPGSDKITVLGARGRMVESKSPCAPRPCLHRHSKPSPWGRTCR
jgi:hypothetical protein